MNSLGTQASANIVAETPRSAFRSRPALVLIFLSLLAWLPFINQAFTVDDTNFLALASHAWPNPLKLYDFKINWLGEDQRAFDILANPPLVPWYLYVASRVARGREWVFHLSFWPFLVLSLAGTYRLGRRFAGEQGPVWTMIWTATAPALIVSAHNIMPDLPLFACYVLGTALTIDAFDQDREGFAIGGGLLAGLSALCRYSGMTVIPLLVLYALLNRVRWRVAAPAILAAAAPIAAWTIASYEIYGRVHWMAMAGFETRSLFSFELLPKSIYQLVCLGLVIALGPLLAMLLSGEPQKRIWTGAALGILVATILRLIPIWRDTKLPPSADLLLAIGLAGAGVVFAVLINSVARLPQACTGGGPDADNLFLTCWILGILAFNMSLLFASVRYVLPALVPAVLVLQRSFPKHPPSGEQTRSKSRWWLAVAISFSLGMLLSTADQKFAGIYRDYATAMPRAAKQRWFTGHWGFQYYMEQTGARALSKTSLLASGDEIVTPLTPWPQAVPVGTKLELISRSEFPSFPGLRPITFDGGGCFYSYGVAQGPSKAYLVLLPFGFSNEPMDVLTRWKVVATSK